MPDPHFVGILDMEPNPADANTLRVKSKGFAFYDEKGTDWDAAEGEITDGASIPSLLKPIIGHSFDSLYLPAAVLHDLACQQRIRSWRSCAEMLREALVTSGISRPRAFAMWAAVYVFGPHW